MIRGKRPGLGQQAKIFKLLLIFYLATGASLLPGLAGATGPPAGTWGTTGGLTDARQYHTTTLLPNSKVLVVGGDSGSGALASAELYDPDTGAWTPAGSLNEARSSHTATLLPNGLVLVAGGTDSGGNALKSAELFDPAAAGGAGVWTYTGPLATARGNHTATLLPNGKVLVAGGADRDDAELYNPATGTWASIGYLSSGTRGFHTATLLPNGKVLLAGGFDGTNYLDTAELYDPATNSFSGTGTLGFARKYHTATLLPNGQVLVAGGDDGIAPLNLAELYDPAAGTWTSTGNLNSARYRHTATLLPNGQVLVAGGSSGPPDFGIDSAELYDPNRGTWIDTDPLAAARGNHTATRLPNGLVLAVGGSDGGSLASAELYASPPATWTAATGTWIAAQTLNDRSCHTATLLPNGQVLVAGGFGTTWNYLNTAELYDPATGAWSATQNLLTGREGHTATLLPNGKVLVTGGYNGTIGGYLNKAELYDPAAGTWTSTGNLINARTEHKAILLPNGKVLVAGGQGKFGNLLTSAELYDPAAGTWTATGNLHTARVDYTATLLPNGLVLAAGGRGNSGTLVGAELFDPATGVWTTTGNLGSAREFHTATLLPNGLVLVAGGGGAGMVIIAELYNPASGTWAATGNLGTGRENHTATLLPNGQVLVSGGFYLGSLVTDSAELYDPAAGTWTTATGHLHIARANHTATLLPNGLVLAVGGDDSSTVMNSAELYGVFHTITASAATGGSISPSGAVKVEDGMDQTFTISPYSGYYVADVLVDGASVGAPTSYTFHNVTTDTRAISASFGISNWNSTGDLNTGRKWHTANLLLNGQVLVAGGEGYDGSSYYYPADTEIYDPSGETWTATPGPLHTARILHTATLLPNGQVLVVGGQSPSAFLASAEICDPAGGTWTGTDPLATPRYGHTATLLPNGLVLVAGGSFDGNGSRLNSAEIYDPASGTWAPAGTFPTAREWHTATLLPNGKVLLAGGWNDINGYLPYAALYDPAAGTWTATTSLANARCAHTATLLANGQVLVAGGKGADGNPLDSAEIYDPASGNWSATSGSLATARSQHTATLLPNGKVLVAGGEDASGNSLASAEIYDPASGNWSTTPADSLGTGRVNHAATLLPNGRVLVDGGYNNVTDTILSSAELYGAANPLLHLIAATSGPHGGIWPCGPVLVNYGVSQTFTITPQAGYQVADVVVGGVSQGPRSSYTFTYVTGNSSIQATFAPVTHTITTAAGTGGSISPSGTLSLNDGASQTFTITANTGYHITNVTVDGSSVGAVTSYPFNSVTRDHSITASFAINTNTISSSAGSNGSISPAGAVPVNYGGSQTFSIIPTAGYHVADVLVNGVSVGAVTSYNFTNVTANQTISASFAINNYTISASAGAGGSISPSGPVLVNYGGSQSFTITPTTGYHISDVQVDGSSVGAVSSYNFSNVTSNHTIAASFAIDTFTITASAGTGGSISPSGPVTVDYGGSQTFTITPNTGYHIADVLVDGSSVGAVSSYPFTNVTANHTISASFAINTYTIYTSPGAGGSISPSSATVDYGGSQTFYIIPNTGYNVTSVLVDGVSVGAVSSYTFSNVTASHTISATFATTGTYTITASAAGGGTISPAGAVSVYSGASQSFTMTPGKGYRLADVLVDGSSVGPRTWYTFTNVTANHTISASFAISLAFPLRGFTPTSAPVSAVMDNSVLERTPIQFYQTNYPVIKAFNGETGEKQYGCYYMDPWGAYWPAYKNSSQTDFFPANAAGQRPLNYINGPYLSYAGMPGYNYQVPQGTPVLATANGRLYQAVTDPVNGAGYSVYQNSYIDHGNGWYSWYLYAPLNADILAQISQNGYAQVTKGQVIGQTIGDRLHFEVRYNGVDHQNVVDPYKLGLWNAAARRGISPAIDLLLKD